MPSDGVDRYEGEPHAFYATRKGTPMGETSDWWKVCDECGRGPIADVHQRATQGQMNSGLLRAIDGGADAESE